MAIYRLLENSAFGPEQIGYMTAAYEVEIAQTGERDPLQIRMRAIAELSVPSHDTYEHPQHLNRVAEPGRSKR
jgi:hypothetical protein